ncbi:MAG: DUF1501 domain-containing protein, partial [Acidimicrobiales bacterium]
ALAERPWAAADPARSSSAGVIDAGHGTLVLVGMYGGNDGVNTVIPVADPAYRAARPDLGYEPNQVLDLGDGLALNPKLPAMKAMWDGGQLAVVRGVSYPNPSLSHFQAMDIWQTANVGDGSGPGWLGRWLDATGSDPMRAVSIGSTLPVTLRGERAAAAAVTSTTVTLPGDPREQMAFSSLVRPGSDRQGVATAVSGAGEDLLEVQKAFANLHAPQPASPGGGALASQLAVVASLIRAGAPTRVYHVSFGSFDTHAGERAAHERLLAELDGGVGRFFNSLKGSPQAAGVVVMTYSEFGRRVTENASGGTDHGTAAPMFVAGPEVKGGRFYGEQPSLTKLDANGNLLLSVDFRQVYATVLERVLRTDAKSVLGGSFATLAFL